MHGLHYSNLDVAYIIVLINSAIAKAEFRVPNDNMCSDGRVLTQLLLPPPPVAWASVTNFMVAWG